MSVVCGILVGSRRSEESTIRRLASLLAALAVLGGLAAAVPATAGAAAQVPAGFTDEQVLTVGSPTAIEFMPDGTYLVTTQQGRLLQVHDGQMTTLLDLSARICANSERGLLGVAVGQDVAQTGGVFLYYTVKPASGSCPTRSTSVVNRLSRFTLDDGVIDPASEQILIDGIYSYNGNHNGGDVAVGPDGLVYASVGDGGRDWQEDSGSAGSNDAARDTFTLLGKIIRVTQDGGIPQSNPYAGAPRCNAGPAASTSSRCAETFASGLRNPFRIVFDRDSTTPRLRINDVGQGTWEEVDDGIAGADYGWNEREGPCANASTTDCGPPRAGLTNPIEAYRHADGCASITGGAFVPDGAWPAEYDDTYLYADYVCGTIFARDDASGDVTELATGLGGSSAVHLEFGPDGALYYTSYAGGGEVRRITPPAREMPPGPSASPTPTATAMPTSTPTASATPTASPAPGAPTAELLDVPTSFRVGQELTVRGRGTRADGTALPADAVSLRVWQHHDQHRHPYAPPTTGGELTFTTPAPEDLPGAETSYLTVELTVTDGNRRTVVEQRIEPEKVDLTLTSEPEGAVLTVIGVQLTTPATVTSWVGWELDLVAPESLDVDGTPQAFADWSTGATTTRTTFVQPPVAAQVTARYGETASGAFDRVAGAERIATAAALAADGWPDGAATVVVARADAYADALAGAPLAAVLDAPLVLTTPDGLSPATAEIVRELGTTSAVVLGGEAALSPAVVADMSALGVDVRRIGGADRFATAARIADALTAEGAATSGRVWLVEGLDEEPERGWPDAVSAAWAAARAGEPLLLTTTEALVDPTAVALEDLAPEEVVVVGGPAAVGSAVVDAVETPQRSVRRLAGAERYATSVMVAEDVLGGATDVGTLFAATGRDWPDALSAGPATARAGGVLLLVDGLDPEASAATTELARRLTVGRLVVVGGSQAVFDAVAAGLRGG